MIEPGSTSESGFTFIGETVLHDGYVISVAQGEFETPEGDRITRDIVHHPGAVAVVAIDGDEVILVRQYRAALHIDLLEIPAGKRDVAGEAPELTAARELEEEVGLRPLDSSCSPAFTTPLASATSSSTCSSRRRSSRSRRLTMAPRRLT